MRRHAIPPTFGTFVVPVPIWRAGTILSLLFVVLTWLLLFRTDNGVDREQKV